MRSVRSKNAVRFSLITVLLIFAATGCPDTSDDRAREYFRALDRRVTDDLLPVPPDVCTLHLLARHAGEQTTTAYNGLLRREIFRQALLATARTRFGLKTIDDVMRETPNQPVGGSVYTLDVRVFAGEGSEERSPCCVPRVAIRNCHCGIYRLTPSPPARIRQWRRWRIRFRRMPLSKR
jgi:hypothetical protein